jgi:methionyl-tRNA synthetase
LEELLYELVCTLRVVAHLVCPVMPGKAQEIWQRLGQAGDVSSTSWSQLMEIWRRDLSIESLNAGSPLFPKEARSA